MSSSMPNTTQLRPALHKQVAVTFIVLLISVVCVLLFESHSELLKEPIVDSDKLVQKIWFSAVKSLEV